MLPRRPCTQTKSNDYHDTIDRCYAKDTIGMQEKE